MRDTKVIINNVVHYRQEAEGFVCYRVNNKLHREDNGPAIIWDDKVFEWYKDGRRHRKDGPAIEHPNGTARWFINGQHHRMDGPAVIYQDGVKEYWILGKYYSQKQFYDLGGTDG